MTDEALKLQRFKEAVSADIDAQVSSLLDETQAECDKMMESTRVLVAHEAEAKREKLRSEAELNMTRKLSAARLEAQRSVLRKRGELAASVFEKVEHKLSEFRKSPEYAKWLASAVKSAQERYPDKKAHITLAPEDMKYASKLGVPAREDPSVLLGGVIVGFEGLGAVIDCTFDSMLENERAEFCNKKELMSEDRE